MSDSPAIGKIDNERNSILLTVAIILKALEDCNSGVAYQLTIDLKAQIVKAFEDIKMVVLTEEGDALTKQIKLAQDLLETNDLVRKMETTLKQSHELLLKLAKEKGMAPRNEEQRVPKDGG